MKLRDMRRSDWTRITKREYVSRPCSVGNAEGRESLILIRDITAPLTVSSAGDAVKIVEKDYSWLQIARKDGRHWLTAMFDEQDTLLQMYFDVTDGNIFDNPDNPAFRDMYLDVVLRPDGRIVILDRDELDEALETGAVTPEEHAAALRDCDALVSYLRKNTDSFIGYCRRTQRELKEML